MRLTGPQLTQLARPEPRLRIGIVLRLSPKAAAEVSYNPPSHSLSDLPTPTVLGRQTLPKGNNKVDPCVGGPGQRLSSATPLGLAQVSKRTPTLTQP